MDLPRLSHVYVPFRNLINIFKGKLFLDAVFVFLKKKLIETFMNQHKNGIVFRCSSFYLNYSRYF